MFTLTILTQFWCCKRRYIYPNILRGRWWYAKLKGNMGKWQRWQREGMFTSRRWCKGLKGAMIHTHTWQQDMGYWYQPSLDNTISRTADIHQQESLVMSYWRTLISQYTAETEQPTESLSHWTFFLGFWCQICLKFGVTLKMSQFFVSFSKGVRASCQWLLLQSIWILI